MLVCVCVPHTRIHKNIRPAMSGHSVYLKDSIQEETS